MIKMSAKHMLLTAIDSPVTWSVIGFVVGLGLGANLASMWIMLAALICYLLLLRSHSVANPLTETGLFATGPSFLICWAFGFVVHGWAF